MPPLVSVIMPVYNGARYVAEAIASVRAQTFTDWEVVAVDDGSTDDSAAILQSYVEPGRFTLVRQANQGLSRARNTAIAAARGEWAALLDADDAWEPDYLERMLAALTAAPGAVAAFSGWQYVDTAGQRLPQTVVLPAEAAPQLAETLLYQNALVPSGAVLQRSALLAQDGFDPTLTAVEDWDMWLRLAPLGRFVIVPRALVRYRIHTENKSDNLAANEANLIRVLQRHLGQLPIDAAGGTLRQRRALGSIYFNSALGYYRQSQPALAQAKLAAALSAWPTYPEQPEFYYELACAYQPRGRRGQPGEPGLAEGAALLRAIVRDGHMPAATPAQRRVWWGRACLVLARLTPDRRLARRYAALAVWHAAPREKWPALRSWLRAALPSRLQRHEPPQPEQQP